MPHSWEDALQKYRYPVNLHEFVDAHDHSGWFNRNLETGDRKQTMQFEEYFRAHGREEIEPWYEVVFWKMYSQPSRRDNATRRVVMHLQNRVVSPEEIWGACFAYVKHAGRMSFDAFRRLFGFTTSVIATVASFLAFIAPDEYPMVDTRVARWVQCSFEAHNIADPHGPQLVPPRHPNAHTRVLTMADFEFVESWTNWCRYAALKLSNRTPTKWRARDVEMAVFQAWGRNGPHPNIHLNPLTNNDHV